MNIKNKIVALACCLNSLLMGAPEHCNLFEPYEWLLDPVRMDFIPDADCVGINIGIRFEQAVHVHGFSACHKRNPLQYYQEQENMLTAFFGHPPTDEYGSLIQQYTPFDGYTSNHRAIIKGHMSYGNAVGSLEYWATERLRIGYYLPYYWIKLDDVCWDISDGTYYFEQTLGQPLYDDIKALSNLDLHGFTHKGIGDSSLLLSWQDSFLEKRDFVTGITYSLRGGAHLPTRSEESDVKAENSLFRSRLGYDASWGIIAGGSLALDFGYYVTCGISADFVKYFGDINCRRIKNDARQTDLLLLTKTTCFIDPGFKQEFVVYADVHPYEKSIMFTGAYYYTKQNESEILVCSDLYPQYIAATMQRLEAWTNHNAVFQLQAQKSYDCADLLLGLFVKWGFRGERTLAGTTFGATFTCLF